MILAIESSCDDTSLVVLKENGQIIAESLYSQTAIHNKFGGVVPEVASRHHFEVMDSLYEDIASQMQKKNLSLSSIKKVAATMAPGLVGPLIVGSSFGRGLALGWGCPFVGVHHLRGHVASVLLEPSLGEESLLEKANHIFPALVLLISGGHTSILKVQPDLSAKKLADTADDAAGECFDKCAKMMGLGYPGGPAIEKLARLSSAGATAQAINRQLPRPKSQQGFSFSGLKTAVRLMLEKNPRYRGDADFCWALQECVVDSLLRALNQLPDSVVGGVKSFAFCGGVSANLRIREKIGEWVQERGMNYFIPPLKYCTDNAAMIAAAAYVQNPAFNVEAVQARLPLEE